MRARWIGARSGAAAVVLAFLLVALSAGEARGAPGWSWPVEGAMLTAYSNDEARPYAGGLHRGIDIAAPAGSTVRAARTGTVTYAGPLGYSGLTVAVRTEDGYVTSYLHLSAVGVRRGEAIAGGTRLGAVGTTGRRSKPEPHLHFGVHFAERERRYVDPLSLLPAMTGSRVAVPVAPAPVPLRMASRREPVFRPAPVLGPGPALDWGRPFALAGLALLLMALLGGAGVRAARAARSGSGTRRPRTELGAPHQETSPAHV